jgi:hypothetical protein
MQKATLKMIKTRAGPPAEALRAGRARRSSAVIQGLRFARLADVLAYKQVLLRPKDMADIHVLPSY